ncbi:LysM peptidoglycan-binding domain-containing protein [Occultella aeris]|uniref:LysM domain/BON superfamily protein n=2 Tax=Occultella aeris TaxID=2761496 RepID=A0A7M4DJU3_9MICO|nr:LysM domain/BON superfamily protein [Occultella aeris]
MTRNVRALCAAVALLALLVGIPAVLWVLGRDSLPTRVPSWEQVLATLAHPLTAGFLTGLLTLVGAIAWATFLAGVLMEVPAALGHRPTRQIRGLRPQRRLAAALLGAIFLSGMAAPALAPAAQASATVHEPSQVIIYADLPADQPSTPDPGSTDQEEEPDAPSPGWQTHMVEPGDTLWDIAQSRLGDGQRWREIADLNYGLPQPDGHALTDAHWLKVGWQLRIPGTEFPGAETVQNAATEVMVQPGDTLFEIAAEHLGDGNRYPEIFDASRDLPQPGGAHLVDPDVIDVGWHLLIPAATEPTALIIENAAAAEITSEGHTGEEVPATETYPQEASTTQPGSTDPNENTAPDQTAEQQHREAEGAVTSADSDHEADTTEHADDAGVVQRTTGGAGALLAAGIVTAIVYRRHRTHRTRPTGTRVAMPEPGSPEEAVEKDLRTVAGPDGRATVNLALRDLAMLCQEQGLPRPQIRAARFAGDGSELQLYLETATDLPSPWRSSADRQIWLISDTDLADVTAQSEGRGVPAPWPALVSIGQDEEDAHLLVDLEHLGQLDIRGEAEAAHATLAALAVQLATSEWADDIQVTLVGVLPELVEAIDTSRIRHVPDLAAVLDTLEARAQHLREHAPDSDFGPAPWSPEIIITGTDIDPQVLARVETLVGTLPRVGIAAITQEANSGEWAIELDPARPTEAMLRPAGLRLRPQQISTTEYAGILNILAGADRYTPGPAWTQALSRATEPDLAELPAPDPAEQVQPTLAPVVDPVRFEAGAPVVRLLGGVDITGVDESVLSGTPTHLSQAVEMIAYMVLNPGATTAELTRDLWPDREAKASTRQSAVSRARRLLGTNDAGEPYLSLTGTDPLGNSYNVLPQVRSDWDNFNELRGDDPTTVPLDDLRKALALVRGTPFSRVRAGQGRVRANRYLWADRFAYEMTASITDVACETARRALLEGKPKLAAEAARAGLRATRDEERTWRYAIRAHIQLGDHVSVEELVEDLTTQLTDLEVDPEPETNQLLDELDRSRRVAG